MSMVAEQVACPECAGAVVFSKLPIRGEVMALRHRVHPTFGVQFHPESVLTEHGYDLMAAFLDRAAS